MALAVTISVVLVGSSVAVAGMGALGVSAPSGLADATNASTETLAAQIAQKYGHAVVIDPDTTETRQVSALPDGQRRLVESTTPVRVKSGSAWVPVDLAVSATPSGVIEPKAAAVPMKFSAGGTGQLVGIASSTGEWLTETWPLGALPAPHLSGATATYANVLPGVDLTLTAAAWGLSQVLVEHSAAAASQVRLTGLVEQFSGMTLAGNADGTATATASDGSQLTSSVAEFWDSSSAGGSIEGPGDGGTAQPVISTVTHSTVSMTVTAAAQSARLVYPVFIGAGLASTATGWFIDQGYSATDFRGHSFLKVGRAIAADSSDGIDHLARSFWQFPVALGDVDVTAAQFSALETWGGSGQCIGEPVDLYRSESPAGYTWTTGNPPLDSFESSVTADARNSAACPNQTLGFDVSEAARWAASTRSGLITLTARARDEGEGYSIEYKQFAPTATLTVTYNSYPNVPNNPSFTSPVRACGLSVDSPTYLNDAVQPLGMQVSSTDPDGDNVSTTFTVRNTATGAIALPPISTPLQGEGSAAASIPQNALTNGSYSWAATASDGLDNSRGASPPCYFQIENSGPGLPTLKETSAGSIVSPATGTVGRPMTIQITGSALGTKSAQFGYWWTDGKPTSPSPAPPVLAAPQNSLTGMPACPAASGSEHFVCADGSGSAVITVGPIDTPYSTLWVAAYDAYGNLSTNAVDRTDPSNAAGLRVTTTPDSNHVQYRSAVGGDLWRAGAVASAAIVDANPTHIDGGMSTTNGGVVASMPKESPLSDKKTLAFSGQTALETFTVPSGQFVTAPSWAVPSGSSAPVFQGWMIPYPSVVAHKNAQAPAGMVTLYECASSAGSFMDSTSSDCEGTGMTATPLGFIWAKASSTADKARAISRCGATGLVVRGNTACPTGMSAVPLGYTDVTEDNAFATDTTAFTDDSKHGFTYSAWVDPDPNGALSASDTDSHVAFAYDGVFQLVDTPAGKWNLCWNDVTGQSGQSCITGPKVRSGAWTFISVSWDSSNDQMRLTFNGKVSEAYVASRVPQSTQLATDHIVSVGAAYPNGGQVWNGYIDDISAFPGVADATEFAALMNESAPQ